MAQSGADAIRSLKDENSIFKAFDSYPWTRDQDFIAGLTAILGAPESSQSILLSNDASTSNTTTTSKASPTDLATHARIFYYAQRIGVTIDFVQYQAWLAKNPQHQPPDILPAEFTGAPPPSSSSLDGDQDQNVRQPQWQQAAPKSELYVDRGAKSSTAAAAADDQPAYPMGFAEMIRLLQEGKEIPGIRQIPNTLARDPSVKPVGARAAPRKPWERQTETSALQEEQPRNIDADFPPVDGFSTSAV